MADTANWLGWWRRKRQRAKGLQDSALPVVSGLRDGDLQPLAKYLEDGGLPESSEGTVALPKWLADEIVAMIKAEPWCWYRLDVAAQKRGRGWSGDLKVENERDRVGFFAETRIRELGPKSYEAAVQEACDHFGKKRTYVTEALGSVREYLEEATKHGLDGWQVLTEIYSGKTD